MSESSRQQLPHPNQPDRICDSACDVPTRLPNSLYAIEIADSQEFVAIDEELLREVTEKTLAAESVARALISGDD